MKVAVLVVLLALSVAIQAITENCNRSVCGTLRPGQYYCLSPEVDNVSQSIVNCTVDNLVTVPCYAAPNISCDSVPYDESQCIFTETRQCRYVNGRRYNYYVAVGLSLFLGFLGIDRFYLGYPAIGLMKLCTLGFFLIGHLLDFLLILIQVVGPADRSGYYAPFYGPLVSRVNGTDPYFESSMCESS